VNVTTRKLYCVSVRCPVSSDLSAAGVIRIHLSRVANHSTKWKETGTQQTSIHGLGQTQIVLSEVSEVLYTGFIPTNRIKRLDLTKNVV